MGAKGKEIAREKKGQGARQQHAATNGADTGWIDSSGHRTQVHLQLRVWCSGMELVELGNSIEGVVKLSAVFPLTFLMRKPMPVDKILDMAMLFPRVQDSFNLLFFGTIDQVRWWWWWSLLGGEHARGVWPEEAFIKNWVDSLPGPVEF